MNKIEIKEFVKGALERGDLDPDPVDRDLTDDEITYDCESKRYLLLCTGGTMYDSVLEFLEDYLDYLEQLNQRPKFCNHEVLSSIQILKKFLLLNGRDI